MSDEIIKILEEENEAIKKRIEEKLRDHTSITFPQSRGMVVSKYDNLNNKYQNCWSGSRVIQVKYSLKIILSVGRWQSQNMMTT